MAMSSSEPPPLTAIRENDTGVMTHDSCNIKLAKTVNSQTRDELSISGNVILAYASATLT